VDVPLFGNIVNEDYVPPAADEFLDAAAPPQPEDLFVNVPVQAENPQLEAILDDIETFGHLDHLEGENVENIVEDMAASSSDGGSTPPTSPRIVPSDTSLENIRRFDLRRFKRIQRRKRAGTGYVRPDVGKRPRQSEPTDEDWVPPMVRQRQSAPTSSSTPRVDIPRVNFPVQPLPSVIQELMRRLDTMQQTMTSQAALIQSQSAVLEAQAAQIKDLELQTVRVPILETRVLELEALAVVSGESGLRAIETTTTTSAGTQTVDVNNSDINENLLLDYFASSENIPGQPIPIAVDYSEANITYLQSLINPVNNDDISYDFEDVEVEPESPS
jgi:hypothetical protein